MKFIYESYNNPAMEAIGFWPRITVEDSSSIYEEQRVIDFFDRFNVALVDRPNQNHWRGFNAIGDLEGISGFRFFDASTGRQFGAISRDDGIPLNADNIVHGIFSQPRIRFGVRRSVRPIRVLEGTAIHLAVDADFMYSLSDNPAERDSVRLTYEGEVA